MADGWQYKDDVPDWDNGRPSYTSEEIQRAYAHTSNSTIADGWQHKDDYPADPFDFDDPQDWGEERQRTAHWTKTRRCRLSREKGVQTKEPITDHESDQAEETKGTKAMMNTREAVALMQLSQGARLIGVKFMAEGFVKPDQKTYTYKVVDSTMQLAFNDLVVVEARDAYAIAQVVELSVSPSKTHVELGKVRHVVQKIDLDAHNAMLRREDSAVERLAMAEVNDRLQKFRDSLGGARFDEVAALIGGPQQPEPKQSGGLDVEIDKYGVIHRTDTGEVVGYVNNPDDLATTGLRKGQVLGGNLHIPFVGSFAFKPA